MWKLILIKITRKLTKIYEPTPVGSDYVCTILKQNVKLCLGIV